MIAVKNFPGGQDTDAKGSTQTGLPLTKPCNIFPAGQFIVRAAQFQDAPFQPVTTDPAGQLGGGGLQFVAASAPDDGNPANAKKDIASTEGNFISRLICSFLFLISDMSTASNTLFSPNTQRFFRFSSNSSSMLPRRLSPRLRFPPRTGPR